MKKFRDLVIKKDRENIAILKNYENIKTDKEFHVGFAGANRTNMDEDGIYFFNPFDVIDFYKDHPDCCVPVRFGHSQKNIFGWIKEEILLLYIENVIRTADITEVSELDTYVHILDYDCDTRTIIWRKAEEMVRSGVVLVAAHG